LNILKDEMDPCRQLPAFPTLPCYKLGLTTIRKIASLPEDGAMRPVGPQEVINLGGGHTLSVGPLPSV
jgi:hypothetical protein